jgi:putative transposase
MPRKRFTEEQIAFALRQHEVGAQVAEIIRKLGVTEQTFYRWKKKFAGLGVAELRRLRRDPRLSSATTLSQTRLALCRAALWSCSAKRLCRRTAAVSSHLINRRGSAS